MIQQHIDGFTWSVPSIEP